MSKQSLNTDRILPRCVLMGLCVASLVGCANQAEPSVGMANPASVYCGERGGQVEIQKTSAGEVGICVLPSGERIEEWELFRRDHREMKS